MKKILLLHCLVINSLKAALDMNQDRPFTTDISPLPTQLYFNPQNPTRDCLCHCGINSWARCNARRLKIKPCNASDCCRRVQPPSK